MFEKLKNKTVTISFEAENIEVRLASVKEAKTIQSDYDLQSDNEDKIIEEIKRFLLYYVVNLKMEDLDNLAFATLMDLFNVVAATATGKKSKLIQPA
jgi:hypothetical protein